MTQKVIHNKNIINIKIGHTTKKKRRKSKHKKHRQPLMIHPYTNANPITQQLQTNKPYYVETSSIHPLMQDQSKSKSIDIKDLITAPEPPPALPHLESEYILSNAALFSLLLVVVVVLVSKR